MSSSTPNFLSDLILDLFEKKFKPYCLSFNKLNEYEKFMHILKKFDPNINEISNHSNYIRDFLEKESNFTILNGIIFRLNDGIEYDLLSYLQQHFNFLPEGLMMKLNLILSSINIDNIIMNTNNLIDSSSLPNPVTSSDHFEQNSPLHHLWSDWKLGKISNIDFFRYLNELNFQGIISQDNFINASSIALAEAGYIRLDKRMEIPLPLELNRSESIRNDDMNISDVQLTNSFSSRNINEINPRESVPITTVTDFVSLDGISNFLPIINEEIFNSHNTFNKISPNNKSFNSPSIKLSVHSHSGDFIHIPSLVSGEDFNIKKFYSPCNHATSNDNFWWRHVGDSKQLMIIPGTTLNLNGNSNYNSQRNSQSSINPPKFGPNVSSNGNRESNKYYTGSTLIIGDSIKTKKGTVEIDNIISLDILNSQNYQCNITGQTQSEIVFLIEGRWVSEVSPALQQSFNPFLKDQKKKKIANESCGLGIGIGIGLSSLKDNDQVKINEMNVEDYQIDDIHCSSYAASSHLVRLCDGVSEIAKQDDPHSTSPNGSGNEENPHIIPDYTHSTQYYIIYATIINENVIIRDVCGLQEILEPDMIPLTIKYTQPGYSFLYGTNGLLAMITIEYDDNLEFINNSGGFLSVCDLMNKIKSKESTDLIENIKKNDLANDSIVNGWENNESNFISQRIVVRVMTRDSILLDSKSSFYPDSNKVPIQEEAKFNPYYSQGFSMLHNEVPVSHLSDNVIINIQFQPSSQRLVTLDDNNTICLWQINNNHFTLLGPPFHFPQEQRVYDIFLSPSGDHLGVSFFDRLILLKTTFPTSLPLNSNENTPYLNFIPNQLPIPSTHLFYERSTLDILEGVRCKYFMYFYKDLIYIWRFTKDSSKLEEDNLEESTDEEEEEEINIIHDLNEMDIQKGTKSKKYPNKISISFWSHKNVDQFLERLNTNNSYNYNEDQYVNHYLVNPNPQNLPCVIQNQLSHLPFTSSSSEMDQPLVPSISGKSLITTASEEYELINNSVTTSSSLSSQSQPSGLNTYQFANNNSNLNFHNQHTSSKFHSNTFPTLNTSSIDGSFIPLGRELVPVYKTTRLNVHWHSDILSSLTSYGHDQTNLSEESLENEDFEVIESSNINRSFRSNSNLLDDYNESSRNRSFDFTNELDDEDSSSEMSLEGDIDQMTNIENISTSITNRSPESSNNLSRIRLDMMGFQVNHNVNAETRIEDLMDIENSLVNVALPEPPSNNLFFKVTNDKIILHNNIQSFYNVYGMVRPIRNHHPHLKDISSNYKIMRKLFRHDHSDSFLRIKLLLSIYGACYQPPSVGLVCALLECSLSEFDYILKEEAGKLLYVDDPSNKCLLVIKHRKRNLLKWLCSRDPSRIGGEFWIDIRLGHNLLCALYLKYCGNKSVAVEHTWQDYLQTFGPMHLRNSTRNLRLLTTQIRKIDETAGIKYTLPYQIGYISGLQEIYARRVGLSGNIPKEIGQLKHLRVLSMGNNRLTGELPVSLGYLKQLQRIVLHQNNLIGKVPFELGELGCIVNLAGNPRLEYGDDVPQNEREALIDLYKSTNGNNWNTKLNWISSKPVCKWYKVGVLSNHVHSLVMSSNNMDGVLNNSIIELKQLRMIELATMPNLVGSIPKNLCNLVTLRRLCICRCGLTGNIPEEIGLLINLEELQLFGNRLNGSIPNSLGNLVNLRLLSLGEYTGGNNFNHEPLPNCIAKLTKLEALFMANCNIKGILPNWIGNLVELRQLDLQRNYIHGVIPKSIGKLDNLLYLNIKDNNQLGGKLPIKELLGLTKLNRLSLVHCNFKDTNHVLETMKIGLPRCKIWI